MKHLAFTFLIAVCAVAMQAQTAHYVSLYPTPGPNRYTTVQAAVDASSAGDTVYVEGGSYDEPINVEINLVVIGVGWNQIGADSTVTTNLRPSNLVGGVAIRNESHVELRGLTLGGVAILDSTSVTIIGCHITGQIYSVTSNVIFVLGSVLTMPNLRPIIVRSNPEYFHLESSVVLGGTQYGSLECESASSAVIRNCFIKESVLVNNTIVQNCILGDNWDPHTGSGNAGANCLFVGVPYQQSWGIPNSSGGYTSSELFESAGSSTWGKYYKLKSNSPAIGAGTGGTDCGIFGGSVPFVLGGIPNVPWIHQLNLNAAGSQGGGVDVNVKVRAQ